MFGRINDYGDVWNSCFELEDIFEQLGLTVPTTWEEFLEYYVDEIDTQSEDLEIIYQYIYDNKYDEEILTRTPGNEDYKIINLKIVKIYFGIYKPCLRMICFQ